MPTQSCIFDWFLVFEGRTTRQSLVTKSTTGTKVIYILYFVIIYNLLNKNYGQLKYAILYQTLDWCPGRHYCVYLFHCSMFFLRKSNWWWGISFWKRDSSEPSRIPLEDLWIYMTLAPVIFHVWVSQTFSLGKSIVISQYNIEYLLWGYQNFPGQIL